MRLLRRTQAAGYQHWHRQLLHKLGGKLVIRLAGVALRGSLLLHRRFVHIALDGLRTSNPTALPGRALDFTDVDRPAAG